MPSIDSARRLSELQRVRDELRSGDRVSDAEFSSRFGEAVTLLEQPRDAIADLLLVSRPTVSRWIRGMNLPHPGMRRSIFQALDAELEERVRALTRESRPGSRRNVTTEEVGRASAVMAFRSR